MKSEAEMGQEGQAIILNKTDRELFSGRENEYTPQLLGTEPS